MCVLKVHFSTLFLFLVSFTSLFHHCLSLPLWASITFAFPHSASICFPFFTTATPPTASALWHFFPSGGLRPAVAVWFELFQVFLQQQREIVMVLAGCVRTNSWGMWFTKQRVRKCWKLTEYIFYIYSIKEKKSTGHRPVSFNSGYMCSACPNQFRETGLLTGGQACWWAIKKTFLQTAPIEWNWEKAWLDADDEWVCCLVLPQSPSIHYGGQSLTFSMSLYKCS